MPRASRIDKRPFGLGLNSEMQDGRPWSCEAPNVLYNVYLGALRAACKAYLGVLR